MRSRCCHRRSCCEKVDVPTNGIPDKIGSYPINDPEGLYRGQALAGYGLMWNTRYMQAQQAAGAEGMGRPREAGLLRPRRDLVAFALGHDPPHLRDHPAGRRLGQGLEPDPADRRQLRRDHRAQLRRARRRAERPVRHRPGDRLLRPRREGLGLPGRVRLPERDRDRAGQHRRWSPARRAPKARKRFMQFTLSEEGQQLLLDPKISRLPVLPATYAKAPAGYPNPFGGTIQAKVNFDSDLSESRYYVVLVAVRPGHHLPPQGAAGGDQGDPGRREAPRRPRQPAARGSEEARLDAAGERRAGRRTRSCSRVFKAKKGDDAALRKQDADRGGVEQQGQGQLRPRRRARRPPRNDPRRGRAGDRGLPRGRSSSSPVASVFYAAFASGAGGFTLGALRDVLPDLADARVVLEQPLRRRHVGRVRLADRGAARLLHGALPLPRRAPDPDARRAAADHAALRRRGRDAAALRPLGLGEPAAERRLRLRRSRSWRA